MYSRLLNLCFCRGDISLVSDSYDMKFDVDRISLGIPDRGLVPIEGHVDSQASQPFSFVVSVLRHVYASVAYMPLYVGS